MPFPIALTVVTFLVACSLLDVKTRRIPNILTGFGMVVGLLLNTIYFGKSGLAASAAGIAVVMGALLAPFAFGGIGGGDVKMMGAVGSILGPKLALAGLVLGMLLGGGIMAWHLGMRGRLGEKMASTGAMVAAAAATRSLGPLFVSASDPGAITLPYSVPLALGTVAVLALQGLMRLP
jgi:prepilin peptidase CpaA